MTLETRGGQQVTTRDGRFVGPCPRCDNRIGLPLGRRLRCRICGREFHIKEIEPKPEHYALTEQKIAYLRSKPGEIGEALEGKPIRLLTIRKVLDTGGSVA
jgi:hypothetical protein